MSARNPTNSLVISLLLLAFALPNSSWAVPYERFDKMGIEAQAEFVAVMVEVTKTVVRREGKSDQWIKIDRLFTTVDKGDDLSAGIVEYQRSEAETRGFDVDRVKKDPNARRLDVEEAWFATLKTKRIELSKEATTALLETMAAFHPLTYKEYVAKSIPQRMAIMEAFAAIAFPDYCFRKMLEDKEKTILNLNANELSALHKVMDEQFPLGVPDQPGFEGVNKQIEAAGMKPPDQPGPLHELISYVLNQVGKGL